MERQRLIQQSEYEISIKGRENDELRSSLQEYERRIVQLAQENERLNGILKKNPSPTKPVEPAVDYKKIAEYENKLAILNQEIERLSENLRNKSNEGKSYEQKIREYEIEIDRLVRKQNENNEYIVSEYERKNSQNVREIDRLREELKNAQQQLNRKNSDHQLTSNVNRENEAKIKQLFDENGQLVQRLSDYEYQITTLSH